MSGSVKKERRPRPRRQVVAHLSFPIESTIPLVIGKHSRWLGMFEAKVAWDRTNVVIPRAPEPGTVVEVTVKAVRQFGAIVFISDRLHGLIHRSTIIEEKSGDFVDLRVSRRAGAPSGFERDKDFRWNVLEHYDNTCCVCGARRGHYTQQSMPVLAPSLGLRSMRTTQEKELRWHAHQGRMGV